MIIFKSPQEVLDRVQGIKKEELERILCHEGCSRLEDVESLWMELKVELWLVDESFKIKDHPLLLHKQAEFSERLEGGYLLSLYIISDYGEGVYILERDIIENECI